MPLINKVYFSLLHTGRAIGYILAKMLVVKKVDRRNHWRVKPSDSMMWAARESAL